MRAEGIVGARVGGALGTGVIGVSVGVIDC